MDILNRFWFVERTFKDEAYKVKIFSKIFFMNHYWYAKKAIILMKLRDTYFVFYVK